MIASLPAPPKRAVVPYALFVPRRTLSRIVMASIVVGIVAAPWYEDLSLWLGLGAAVSLFVMWHAIEASRNVPWSVGLSMTSACVQWVIAPWVTYAYAASLGIQSALPPEQYLPFAVASTTAFVAGVLLPLRKPGRAVPVRPPLSDTGVKRTLIAMTSAGLLVFMLVVPFAPGALRYVATLVGMLALVGTCGLILIRAREWPVAAVLSIGMQGFLNTIDAQYLDMMLWTGFIALMVIYTYRPRPRTVVALVLLGFVGLVGINMLKRIYRDAIQIEEVARDERLGTAGDVAGQMVSSPSQILSAPSLVYTLSRLNQGEIIGRVMLWVPSREPYAHGETIMTSVESAILPRVFNPAKAVAGGFDNYRRFTGYGLLGSTSINLGMPGEMYANFGAAGGVAAVFVYGLLLGLLFRALVAFSRRSALWWAWTPFLLYSTISAEMGTNEVLNSVTKALLLCAGVVFVLPAWRRLWRPSRVLPLPAEATLRRA